MKLGNLTGGLGENTTPRPVSEIIKQTKFGDVKNLWERDGVLCTQAGVETLAQLPSDFVIKHVARSNQNSRYIYIIGENNEVYIYNRSIGLKKYKTLAPELLTINSTQYNNNLVMADVNSTTLNLFGDYYSESTPVVLNTLESENFIKIGTVTSSDGVISGFKSSPPSYIALPNIIDTSKEWEFFIKFKTGSLVNNQSLVNTSVNFKSGMVINTNTVGGLRIYLNSTGTYNDIATGTDTVETLEPNTDYVLKASWNKSIYSIEVSTDDGKTFNEWFNVNSSLPIFQDTPWVLGLNAVTSGSVWLGSYDMNGTLITEDGVVTWRGVNFTKDGNIIEFDINEADLPYFWKDKLVSFDRVGGGITGRTPVKGRDLRVTFDNKTPYDDFGLNGVNIYGNPDFSKGYLDNLNTRSGVIYPDFNNFQSYSKWCIQFEIPQSQKGVDWTSMLGASNGINNFGIAFFRDLDSLVGKVNLSSNSSFNDIASTTGTRDFKNNPSYVRLRFTGTQYLLDYSLDYDIITKTGTWVNDITINSTTKVTNMDTGIVILDNGSRNSSMNKRVIDNIEVCIGEDHIPVYDGDTGVYRGVVLSITPNMDNTYRVRVQLDTDNILSGDYNICERTKISRTPTYVMEGFNDKTLRIHNLFIAQNRLFIEDINGKIYYSEVGIFDSFKEVSGAGFIYNFYNDNSPLIDIEEYSLGILITRANGIYRLTIGDTVNIERISNVASVVSGQHIAVNDRIIGFDETSKSILEILKINFLGNLTAGKTLLEADRIIGNFPSINSSRKFFGYNSEFDIPVLYMGSKLNEALILMGNSIWKRTYNDNHHSIRFINGDLLLITEDGYIKRDFDRYSVLNDVTPYVEIEQISGGVSTMLHSKLFEILEYTDAIHSVSVLNDDYDVYSNEGFTNRYGVPDLIYSEQLNKADSFELTSKWADNSVVKTRLALNGGGSSPLIIRIEFKRNLPVALFGINLVDFGVYAL